MSAEAVDLPIADPTRDGPDPSAELRGEGWVATLAPDGLLVVDTEGRIRFANTTACRLTGYSHDELLGRGVEHLMPREARARHIELRTRFHADASKERAMGGPMAIEMLRRDGTRLPIDIALTHVKGPAGPLTIVALRDDSERRRLVLAEMEARDRALQAEIDGLNAGHRFRAGFVNSPHPMLLCDAGWVIREVNAAFCRLVGLPTSLLLGRTWASLCEGDPDRAVLTGVVPVRSSAEEDALIHLSTSAGGSAIVQATWAEVRPGDPRTDRIAHVLDVTDRVRTARLRDSELGVLSRLTQGMSLDTCLAAVVDLVEANVTGAQCVVLLREGDSLHPVQGSFPSGPEATFSAVGRFTSPAGHVVWEGRPTFVNHLEPAPAWEHQSAGAVARGVSAEYAVPLRSAEGQVIGCLALSLAVAQELSRDELAALGLAAELSQIALAQDSLERSRQEAHDQIAFQAGLLEAVGQSVLATDLEGRITYCNEAAAILLGRDAQDMVGAFVADVVPCESGLSHVSLSMPVGCLRPLRGGPDERRIRRGDGTVVPVLVTTTPLFDDAGAPSGEIQVATDISDLHRAREALAQRALRDHLTGLPNRAYLAQLVSGGVEMEGASVAGLFVLALDRFKFINGSRGHLEGDALLVSVAGRLAGSCPSSDTVLRLDGDTFAVVCTCNEDPETLHQHGRDLLTLFNEPFSVSGRSHFVSVSIGVAAPGADRDSSDLLTGATAALHQAKLGGGGRVVFHDDAIRARIRDRHETENDLHVALAGEQFRLFYQPQVDLCSGDISGVEALLRWERPGRGTVGPAEFLAIAEDSGLIMPIGAWVLREACRRGAQWAAEGRPLTVSVNLAAGQLVTADLPDVVTACLAESGLPPSLLCLEITETVLLDDLDELAVQLKALRDLGVGVHIDDFGTGYCSLTYLRQLPVTGIKIDRTFVRGLCSTVEDRAIVSSTINLGRTMGLDVVAEGVEDAVTLAALKELGCTHGQGYLWSRPVDPSELVFAPNLGDSRGLVDGIH